MPDAPPLNAAQTALARAAFDAHCRHMRYLWGPRKARHHAGFDDWDSQPFTEKQRWFAIAEAAVHHNIESSNLDASDYGFRHCARCRVALYGKANA